LGAAEEPSCTHELGYEPFGGLILVPVEVGSSPPLNFVLDSGATQSAITDPFLAEALGLEVRDVGVARGMGSGRTPVHITQEVSIRALGFELLRAPLVVHDIAARLTAMAGREIHGFLGADLFERYVVEIDSARRRLLLHDPRSFSYRGRGEELPLEIVDRRPVVTGRVVVEAGKKPVPVRLVVDTGSSRQLTLIIGSRRQLKPPVERKLGGSVGVVGDTLVVVGRVARLEIGSMAAEAVETAWVEPFRIPAVGNIPKVNGILGTPLLLRYRVFFDYPHGRLILETLSGNPDTANELPD
ncbi:MAG: aspartyl protease family protein, partial [Thermoanaerobaculales bacterium]